MFLTLGIVAYVIQLALHTTCHPKEFMRMVTTSSRISGLSAAFCMRSVDQLFNFHCFPFNEFCFIFKLLIPFGKTCVLENFEWA